MNIKIPNSWVQIKKIATAVLQWSLPVKLIVSAFVGVLGSAGLLSWLSEYATYWYSIYFGSRPAIEGVPYLKASVALGSVFILISAAWAYLVVFLYNKLFYRSIVGPFELMRRSFGLSAEDFDLNKIIAGINSRKSKLVLFSIFMTATPLGMVYFLIKHLEGGDVFRIDIDYIAFGIVFAFVFTANITMLRPRLIVHVAAFFAGLNIIFWLAIMFHPYQHARFLRVVGHGGGYPLTLDIESEGVREAYLFLRTSESYIILEDGQHLTEIPKNRVRSIRHGTNSLHGSDFQLPIPMR